MELSRRASGILLHPTSLPGPFGIGELGTHAYRFVDFLVEAKQSIWQILPLGPVGFGASPYSTFGALAGNPMLISLSKLAAQGDLLDGELADAPHVPADRVDYALVERWKMPRLEQAARRFLAAASASRREAFEQFCAEHDHWLEPFTLFMAIKEHFGKKAAAEGYWGATWNTYWDAEIAKREEAACDRWRDTLRQRMTLHRVLQFYFFEQWTALRTYANKRGIAIMGDMPIFVALDSADVWFAPELFELDEDRQEVFVAGVPPDYFSATGQRWGNPLYRWDALRATNYAWWIHRFRSLLEQVDIIRIDHFRGFSACWAIPATEETAMHGNWVDVPGHELFNTLRQRLGELPFVAEDLGVITPDVEELRDHYEFPGMRVLQVGFENIEIGNIHLPEYHIENCVVYTGTHDNNTTRGWYAKLPEYKQQAIVEVLGMPLDEPAWDFVRVAMDSIARTVIVPMQDVLQLDESARMNTPGTVEGNWTWRLTDDYRRDGLARRLASLTRAFQRSR